MQVPTVKIKKGRGFVLINADEFDDKKHQLFEVKKPVKKKPAAKKPTKKV